MGLRHLDCASPGTHIPTGYNKSFMLQTLHTQSPMICPGIMSKLDSHRCKYWMSMSYPEKRVKPRSTEETVQKISTVNVSVYGQSHFLYHFSQDLSQTYICDREQDSVFCSIWCAGLHVKAQHLCSMYLQRRTIVIMSRLHHWILLHWLPHGKFLCSSDQAVL